ncbi:unnamed protein product [Symbiodinium sp. KB8]|nr:unnamed protein product [Symbiodinium sp. KB8]
MAEFKCAGTDFPPIPPQTRTLPLTPPPSPAARALAMASAVSYPSPGNTYLVLNSANGPKRLRVRLGWGRRDASSRSRFRLRPEPAGPSILLGRPSLPWPLCQTCAARLGALQGPARLWLAAVEPILMALRFPKRAASPRPVALVRSVDKSAGTVNISWLLSKQDLPASLDLQALGSSELLVASWANACVPLSAMRNPVEPSPDALDSGTQHVLIDENSRWGRFLGISRANQKADRQLYSRFVAFRDPDTGAVEVDWDASRSAARPGEASLFPPRCGADEPWMRVCKCGQPVSLEQPMLACSVRASAQCRVVLHCKCSYRSHCAFVSDKTPPAVRLAKFAMGNIDRARPVPRGVTLLEGVSAMCDACATTLRIRPRQLRGELQTVHLAVARAKQQRAEGAEQWADTAQVASVASRRGKRTLADSLCDAITAAAEAKEDAPSVDALPVLCLPSRSEPAPTDSSAAAGSAGVASRGASALMPPSPALSDSGPADVISHLQQIVPPPVRFCTGTRPHEARRRVAPLVVVPKGTVGAPPLGVPPRAPKRPRAAPEQGVTREAAFVADHGSSASSVRSRVDSLGSDLGLSSPVRHPLLPPPVGAAVDLDGRHGMLVAPLALCSPTLLAARLCGQSPASPDGGIGVGVRDSVDSGLRSPAADVPHDTPCGFSLLPGPAATPSPDLFAPAPGQASPARRMAAHPAGARRVRGSALFGLPPMPPSQRDAEQPRYPKRACRSLGLTAFEPVRPAAFALHEDMECSRPRDDAALVGLETQRSTSSAVTNPPPYRVKVTHVFGTSFGARRAEGSCTPATAGPVMTSANPAALVGWRASVPRVSQCC